MVIAMWNDWEEWRKRRKRWFSFWREPFFEEFERSLEEIDEIMRKMFMEARTRPEDVKVEGPYVYGFSMKIGPDGKPEIREFGNVRPTMTGIKKTAREPFTDVTYDEKNNLIRIVAELPGVEKEDIDVECSEETITIKAKREEREYYKEVTLDTKVNPKTCRAKYKNGILEIIVNPKEKLKPRGASVKIE